jgi:hypothetical protein
MKRIVAVLVMLIAAGFSSPAHASSTDVPNQWVSGPVSGSAAGLFDIGCQFFGEQIAATVDTTFPAGGDASLNVHTCVVSVTYPPTAPRAFVGTFDIGTHFGALTGTAECSLSVTGVFACTLTVTSGTRAFTPMHGTLSLAVSGGVDHVEGGPTAGTLAGSLVR